MILCYSRDFLDFFGQPQKFLCQGGGRKAGAGGGGLAKLQPKNNQNVLPKIIQRFTISLIKNVEMKSSQSMLIDMGF